MGTSHTITTSSAIPKSAPIYVAGHCGLVGSAITRALVRHGFSSIITKTRGELNLLDRDSVFRFMKNEKPVYVFLAAAKVGGILANSTYPADFLVQNLRIQTNVIEAAHSNQIQKLLFFGSSCIYPKCCPQPIKETYLLTGELESTNRSYALAKIAGIEQCWAYNRQYGTKYIAAMPSNLYGVGDHYDLENSHVIPALIRKMHEAKLRNSDEVIVWGTGSARREFLFSDDLAEACVLLMNLSDSALSTILSKETPPMINIGSGYDLAVSELATMIAQIVGYRGKVKYDPQKPNGTPQKLLDISRMSRFGWTPKKSLDTGLREVYKEFSETC